MSNKLTDLKNIGNTSALWLNAVGIFNRDQLAEVGTIEAYIRIQDRGIKTSKVLLYTLEGALSNTHWNDIPDAKKQQLLSQAQQYSQALDEA